MDLGPYPPLEDFGFIADCHSVALVSKAGSIDWCCTPRIDSPSVFGRLLDWEKGGYCALAPDGEFSSTRRYVEQSLILETTFHTGGGEARLLDLFTMREGGRENPHRQILRIVEGVRGRVDLVLRVASRFDFGEVQPWIRREGPRTWSAIGGAQGLVISADRDIEREEKHDVVGRFSLHPGDRARLSIEFAEPHDIDTVTGAEPKTSEWDKRFEETVQWWRRWMAKTRLEEGADLEPVVRSAAVLKGLMYAPTGAIAAAATTSLPTTRDGPRNWDYRYSWIRDSTFTVRAFGELGHHAEADGFRRFVERSAASEGEEIQPMFGLRGERRLTEITLDNLSGYARIPPVRIGNAAYDQTQLDVYGELLDLAARWHRLGHSPDDDYWEFLVETVDFACRSWEQPDSGFWEVRGDPEHFTQSKVGCWAAVDRGIRLARECRREAPVERWEGVRKEIRDEIESKGYDRKREVFVRAFGSKELDCALLLLPRFGFVAYDDERMIRTTDAIQDELGVDGLLRRYRTDDGIEGDEGAFLACSFWLVECLVHQGRRDGARAVFDRAVATANDLGLFSEQYDARARRLIGNFPQGLTHLSHIAAAIALMGEERLAPEAVG